MWILAACTAAVAYFARRRQRDAKPVTPQPNSGVTGAALLVAAFAVAFAQTVVVAILTPLADDLHTDAVGATWLLTAFMLAAAASTPIAGRLGDRWGHRRVIILGLTLAITGSALTAASVRAGWYPGAVAGRGVAGLAGGVFPCTFGLARQLLPPERLGGIVTTISAMFGVGGAAGLIVTGPIVDTAGAPGAFWLVAAFAAAGLAGVAVLPAASTPRGFVGVERNTASSLGYLDLLVGRPLAAVNTATVVIGAGMFAAVTLVPLFAQTPRADGYGFGYSTTQTGLLIAPMGFAMIVAAAATARLARRVGARVVFQSGAALAAASLAALGIFHTHPWSVAAAGATLGVAYGLTFGSLGSLVVNASPSESTGAATGINTILRTVGGALGAMISVTILSSSGDTAPTEGSYAAAFFVAAGIATLAAIVALGVPSDHDDPHLTHHVSSS